MKIFKSILFLFVLIFISSCFKDKYSVKPCFTIDNKIFLVGESVKIYNCTTWGSYPNKEATWELGDGTYIRDTVADTISHVYKNSGTFKVRMVISNSPHVIYSHEEYIKVE